MADKIDSDIKEVDGEIKKEENFEVEDDFEEYDGRVKPSVFSRMWDGMKNFFSSDDEDGEKSEDGEDSGEDDSDGKAEENEKSGKIAAAATVIAAERSAVRPVSQSSVNLESEKEKKIHLADLKDDDIGKMIKISVGILERLPQNEFDKFKQTNDFVTYKEIIKKYKRNN